MKAMLIFFNAVEPGGVNTITSGLMNGFIKLGHQIDYYHASNKGRLHRMDRDVIIGKRYLRLKAEQLAHGKQESLLRYRHLVNNYYDCVIFAMPCPHKTRSSGGEDETWKELYKVDKPVFCIFHDNHWDRYYPWLKDVSQYISACFYTVSNASSDSLLRFPPKHHAFLPVLLDTSKVKLNKKSKRENVIWLPQHKKWKGYLQFIKQCFKIKHPVDIYNIGIQYYDVKKKLPDLWQSTINRDHYEGKTYNKKSFVNYHALVRPSEINAVLDEAGCAVDLSGMIGGDQFKGQITCSMIEPMLHGCVSVVHESMITYKHSLFYERDDLVSIIKNEHSIAKDINNIMGDRDNRNLIAKNAFEYSTKYHDSAQIIQKIFMPIYNLAVQNKIETDEPVFHKNYIKMINKNDIEEPLPSKRLNRKFVFIRPTKSDYRKNVDRKSIISTPIEENNTKQEINQFSDNCIEQYSVDYFENGLNKGISLYNNFSWMPERSMTEAMALIDALEIKRSERILDYGCAKGFLVKAFRLLGREAYGCDISRYAICTAENDIRQYLKLCTHGFPFSEMKFKYCVSKDVFEHMSVEEIKNVLFSLKNYCDNLLIIVPLGNGKTFNIPEYNYDTTHKIAQTKDWWIKLIEENGFINIWSTDKIIGIKDNWSQYANGNVFMNFKNRR